MTSQIAKLQKQRDGYLQIANLHLKLTLITYGLALGSFGVAAYDLLKKEQDRESAFSSAVFGILLTTCGVDDNIKYRYNRSCAKEKDCDIYEENGGDMTECKFPKYIRSQFVMDNKPS